MRAFLLLVGLCSALSAAERTHELTRPNRFAIGISPFLDNGVKDEVYRSVVRLLVQDLPLNSTVNLYDAYHLKSITQVQLPDSRVFESPKTRANQFSSAIRALKQFLAQEYPRPTHPRLKFESALRVPQFCDFLAENFWDSNVVSTVLLIGSPLYQDHKEPDFSMVDGYFPSDGHLLATREKSVYGLSRLQDPPYPFVVDWVYFGDPWPSDLYREKISRFWALYLEGRGGELRTFEADLPTATKSFGQGPASRALARHWTIDQLDSKVQMLRIGREVEVADWIQRDSIAQPAQRPPSAMVGPMKIGIRWKDHLDLDLYAAPRSGAETLFFQHPRSSDGYYYKDHRSSPGREYEFVEFEKPVDIREVEAFVNFYKGSCPGGPRGEVRIEFENKIYAASFSIASSQGNRGRAGSSQEEFWTRIPVQEVLKIQHQASAD